MPMNWTAQNNAKLFLCVLDQIKRQNVKLDYQKLAEDMGPDCTLRSVQHQIVKLKDKARQGTSADGGSVPSTPAGTPATATPKKRRVNAKADSAGDDGSPVKKAKKGKKAKKDDSEEDSE
ncbi:uncharacterized protein BJX67DRAFT_385855 [Aspergillus lucknowensis]|uniref:Uncharacterized protein n=1 Tax=Aspergillus lucknowensis TaxID=176173 RepID=A0ABR4LCH0_9EURO